MRLLLIEDDQQLGDAVKTGLMQYGFVVDWVTEGDMALSIVKTDSFDLILLDLSLPKLSGIQLLQTIRGDQNTTPILILTAQESVDARVDALNRGADDFLIKPFDLNELVARIHAIIRRSKGRAETVLTYRNITLNPAAHTVTVDDEPINLPRREFALLQKLLENAGHVLSRDQLMQSLYSWDDDVESNALEVHVHNLRKKLNANFIRTIRGIGYMAEK